MRTLVISPFFDPALPSGGVLYSVDMVRAWLRRGRTVGVICATLPADLSDLAPYIERGDLHLFPIVARRQLRFTHHPHDQLADSAREALADFQPDVIHVHNIHGQYSAIAEAVRCGAPVILTALDFGALCFNFYLDDGSGSPCSGPDSPAKCAACVGTKLHGLAGRWGPKLPRVVTRRVWPDFARLDQIQSADDLQRRWRALLQELDAVIAPSPIMAEMVRAAGVPAARIEEMVYGIAPEKMLRPAKEPAEEIRLGFLGNAEPVKGLHVLLRAAELLPDGAPLRIRALGNAEVRRAIGDATARARRYVQYHPPLFGRALAEEHARLDAMLVPSLWHENSPFVVLESLANGTPVLASDQRGIGHLIDDGRTGRLLPPDDPEAWAAAFARAYERPALIRWMQMQARYDRTTAHYVDELEQVEARWIPELAAATERPLHCSAML